MNEWKEGDVAWVCFEAYDDEDYLFADVHVRKNIIKVGRADKILVEENGRISWVTNLKSLLTKEQAIAEIAHLNEQRIKCIDNAVAKYNKSRDEALATLAQ